MSWIILFVAGLFEVGWAVGLKYTEGFTRPIPTILTVLAIITSMGLLGVAMRNLPLGTAYAIWTGIGAVGAFVVGAVFLGEPLTPLRIAGVALVASGLVVLKLAASH